MSWQRAEGEVRGARDVRVLVAYDQPPVRSALRDLVAGEPGLALAGVATVAQEAIELACATRPDVALLDVDMPGGGGPYAARGILHSSPATAVLALSAPERRDDVIAMLRAGAIGCLAESAPPSDIVEAIARAERGQASLAGEQLTDLIRRLVGEVEQRRDHEAGLADGERTLRALLDAAPLAVLVADEGGRIALLNTETERLFGYAREELLGAPLELLLPELLRGRRKDGTSFPVEVSRSTIETGAGPRAAMFVRDLGGTTAGGSPAAR